MGDESGGGNEATPELVLQDCSTISFTVRLDDGVGSGRYLVQKARPAIQVRKKKKAMT